MHQPTGAAFDLVLLLHVGSALTGLVTVGTATAMARRLSTVVAAGVVPPEVLLRYFRPGFNWGGRTVYGIPVFGVALVLMSGGAYGFTSAWVLAGLGMFAGVVVVAEVLLWPAEQRVQRALAGGRGTGGDADDGRLPAVGRDARTMVRAGAAVVALLVLATAVMVAQP